MRDQAADFDTPEEADFDAHIKGANFDALKTPLLFSWSFAFQLQLLSRVINRVDVWFHW